MLLMEKACQEVDLLPCSKGGGGLPYRISGEGGALSFLSTVHWYDDGAFGSPRLQVDFAGVMRLKLQEETKGDDVDTEDDGAYAGSNGRVSFPVGQEGGFLPPEEVAIGVKTMKAVAVAVHEKLVRKNDGAAALKTRFWWGKAGRNNQISCCL